MAKIAVDIALLLPEKINKICIGINRKEDSLAFSDLSKADNHPHITLAMGVIDEKDIKKINTKLKAIVKKFSELNLEIISLCNGLMPNNKISCKFEIKLTNELKKLHASIMQELLPIFTYDVKNEMFFWDSDKIFNEVSKFWVKNYGKKHSNPNNYYPHISLKCEYPEYSKFPLNFIASKVALCHLGNYCTCRTILGLHELK